MCSRVHVNDSVFVRAHEDLAGIWRGSESFWADLVKLKEKQQKMVKEEIEQLGIVGRGRL